jgi:hypothetical protein
VGFHSLLARRAAAPARFGTSGASA